MYVRNHMLPKDKLTTLELGEDIGSALEKINQGDFMSLPVLEGEQFKGYLMKEAILGIILKPMAETGKNF